ncbi:MAG TPA: DoxX family protein [Amycolatopsis sp.]|nr:DoxX family protein [Amycolatopsis sp.]
MTTTATRTQPTATTKSVDRVRPYVLAAFRVVTSALFLMHGLQGFGLFGGIDGHGAAVPLGSFPGFWASAIEVVGAALIMIGVATRPAAFVLSGVMAYAYFTVHAPMGLLPMQNLGEPAALYSWIFLTITVTGPGAFALSRKVRQ